MTGYTLGPSAQRALDGAKSEAERLGSEAIGAEHILLRVTADEPALSVFRAIGLDQNLVRERLELGARKGKPRGAEAGELLLTSHARRLLEVATNEARQRGSVLGAEHFLLAAFSEPRGTVARLLNEAGVSAATARAEVLRVIGAEPEAPVQGELLGAPAREKPGARKERRSRTRDAGDPVAEPAAANPTAKERTGRRRGGREERDSAQAEVPATTPAAGKVTPRQPLPHLRRDRSDWGPLWRRLLLVAVPAALIADAMHLSPVVVFTLACLGVLPLAGFMGDATEHLSARSGPTVGGLLNATFGNAAELIIAIVALQAGLVELVKASITGSILGNLLLIMGLSLLAGGVGRNDLKFNRTAVGLSAGMMIAAVVGLVFPALFHATHPDPSAVTELRLSEGVAVVLMIVYGFSLLFTLKTHRWLIGGDAHEMPGPIWTPLKAIVVLGIATAGVAVMSEVLVHAAEAVTVQVGVTETFLGLIIIPLIGNAAEHATAVVVARKGKMDLALQIAYGSSTQIALPIGPLLVFIGLMLGQDMNLVFTPFEVMAVGLATIVASLGTADGESHWFEGVQLLAVYVLIAIAAFFV
ncbi:MAG TPA: calcium/proton exchanger [Gemmatimonadales bacterium]|nr:calcium/proton exchanger [Gemmatimonadales bacterium]